METGQLVTQQLEEKINDLSNLSQSQKDKLTLDDSIKHSLFSFLLSQMQRSVSKNELREEVSSILLSRVKSDVPEERISTGSLIKILEVLNKSENESSFNILSILKEKMKVEINNNIPPTQSTLPESEFTSEDHQKVKKVLKFFDKLGKSEFSQDI